MKEERRTTLSFLCFVLLFHEAGVPTYYRHHTCSDLNRVIQPVKRCVWQVPEYLEELVKRPEELLGELQ